MHMYVGDNMLTDRQRQKIAKYRKVAKKNVLCKYFAIIWVSANIIVSKFFSYNKRKFILAGQLCIVMVAFLSNTSFAPPTFANASMNVPMEIENVATETISYNEDDVELQLADEHDYIKDEDGASLDDLIEKNHDVTTETLLNGQGTVKAEVDTRDANSEEVVFDKNDWKLLLVNKQHIIPEDYEFTLGTIKGSMRCDERIIDPLTKMFAAAKEDGINLVVRSPYRDMARQEYLFERKVKTFQATGMSYMDAYKKASFTVTVPGASEHQVGLAVDITSDTYSLLNIGFADTPAGKWLAEHSWEYGFILRYPLGKEEITGIQFEPWHFRYVGVDAAQVITSRNITLEEFVENL